MAFSLFPAIFDKPAGFHFASQDPDEQIELLLRQHWFTNVSWILIAVIGVIVGIAIPGLGLTSGLSFRTIVPADIQLSVIILWYLFLLAYVIQHILYWYFNIYILTNKNIIDIAFQNILSMRNTQIRLDDVQSSRYQMRGVFGSLFGYGDVYIETAAEGQQLEFIAIPRPDLVQERIETLQSAQEKGGSGVG